MSKQFKDFRLPNLESNKILILDVNKNITSSDTNINSLLSTDSTLDGEEVTYVPTVDSQPANKKYVDQEITKVETIIGKIKDELTDINGEEISQEDGPIVPPPPDPDIEDEN